jgi:hypothetical protein
MKAKYTIAVCDILGFSSLVERASLDDIVNDTLTWLSKALHHSLHGGNFSDGSMTLTELQAHPNVGLSWFSDTILLFTRRNDNDCLQSLLQCLSWLLFETMYVSTVRVRCGISYGEAFIDPENSLFVGLPIAR